jgi:hypothetical protein
MSILCKIAVTRESFDGFRRTARTDTTEAEEPWNKFIFGDLDALSGIRPEETASTSFVVQVFSNTPGVKTGTDICLWDEAFLIRKGTRDELSRIRFLQLNCEGDAEGITSFDAKSRRL